MQEVGSIPESATNLGLLSESALGKLEDEEKKKEKIMI
jgi:hypothetical protein